MAEALRLPVEPVVSETFEFDLSLPPRQLRFGGATRAAVTGPEDAPLVVVLGGISGNRRVCGDRTWWPGLVAEGGAVDPTRYRVLGIDFIADSSGRAAPSPEDQAAVIAAALDRLSVERARTVIGASYGGMVALSLGQHYSDRVERLIVLSAGACSHPAATGLRELQRRVVALGIARNAAAEALSIARGMAMLSYRTAEEFDQRFTGGLPSEDPLGDTDPGSYLKARGEAFHSVMSPERFLSLSASIDRHNIDPAAISTPTLLIGAASDQLVPPSQMEAVAAKLAGPAELHILPSLYGHDMFLKNVSEVAELVRPFLEKAR